ncbi:hypothetical protein KR032_008553 [Drosophila birchii]|nr:hypothetical protein KR032_008553 [Drosophila birchii]
MGCLSSTFKYILYAFNLIFVIIGVLLIIFGSLMVASMQNATDFEGSTKSLAFPVAVLVIGCVTFLVSFFGCCGTIKENACLTTTYAICMLILFALQMVLSIWLFIEKDTFLDFMSRLVDRAWIENDSAHGYPMDALQLAVSWLECLLNCFFIINYILYLMQLKCCGNQDYGQYGSAVPASCCGYDDRSKECAASIYELRPGCNDEFVNFWASHMDIVRLNSLIIALFQLGIFFISCHLVKAMRWS